MSLAILSDSRLYVILFRMDVSLAEETKEKACPHCGAILDVSNYSRKPRAPVRLEPEYSIRFSFCCRICRQRTTPPSVRFHRQIYLFPVVVVATRRPVE